MHFIVTTPVLNGARYIDEAILSVVAQAGPFTLRYHVQDGGSSDGTLAKLAAWQRRLASDFPILCDGVEFSFGSEADAGLYDAVNRGFAICGEGAVMSWINSDDRFEQGAFASVAQILGAYPDVQWLCGRGAVMDEDSALIRLQPLTPYPRNAVAAGIFEGRFAPGFIMQESVFWRSSLWDGVKGLNNKFRLAGDHDLWRRFANHADLVMVGSVLGYFRRRGGQLSEDRRPYCAEIDASLTQAEKRARRLQSVLHQFGLLKYRVVAREHRQDWKCKAVYGFKIGPLVVPLLKKMCRSLPNGAPSSMIRESGKDQAIAE
ncbi:MAG TPA: glycosyltransferase [Methylovirgula sp.]|nr:glycosyltransferase [Methylovirgula sp.]